jgi:hypothetical protein
MCYADDMSPMDTQTDNDYTTLEMIEKANICVHFVPKILDEVVRCIIVLQGKPLSPDFSSRLPRIIDSEQVQLHIIEF